MTKIKQLEARIKELEENMNRMQVCALIIKRLTQKMSGVDIDKEMERELSGGSEKSNKPIAVIEETETKIKKEPVDKQTVYKSSGGYYTVHNDDLLKKGYVVVKDTRELTVYEKYE